MKKTISVLLLLFTISFNYAQQWLGANNTTSSIFRFPEVGIGYSTLPTFGTNKFMVNGNSYFSGNIGIGTTTPTSKLQISTGNVAITSGQLMVGTPFNTFNDALYGIKCATNIIVRSTDPYNASIDVEGNLGTRTQIAVAKCDGCYSVQSKTNDAIIRGSSTGSFIIANESNGNIKFETGNPNSNTAKIQMMIDNVGNIGIGTGSTLLNPAEKLAVNGLIHTKEVKVDLVGWPDYVFTKEYKLPSLQEVEKQIAEKGHLANIPSAKEVEENGLLLGETNKQLLQKIEELTLYIIEQNKINEKQNKKIDQLEALVNKLINK